MFGFASKHPRCQGPRPVIPVPQGHHHVPGQCSECFVACKNRLLDDEPIMCGECVATYVTHPSPAVRMWLLAQVGAKGGLTREQLGALSRDLDAAIANYALHLLNQALVVDRVFHSV